MASGHTLRAIPLGLPLALLLATAAPARADVAADDLVRVTGAVPPAVRTMAAAGDVPPDTQLPHVVVYLGLRDRAGLEAAIAAQHDPRSPAFGHRLDASEIADRFGPRRAHYERVRRWLGRRGLRIEADSPFRVGLTVSGDAASMEEAFGVRLGRFRAGAHVYRAPRADPVLPVSLGIRGLLGLDDLRPFRALVRLGDDRLTLAPRDFARAYDVEPLWEAGLTGLGATIAVIARSNFDLADVTAFGARFTDRPPREPVRTFVGADPGILPQQGEVTEVLLDTEWTGGIAPEANVRIVIASPDGDIPEALTAAVNAGRAGVISLSFGLCEQLAVGLVAELFDAYYAIANAQGQTVVVAAGDYGKLDCAPASSVPAVNALASSPHAVAVGGTALEASFDADGHLVARGDEVVWNDGGGAGGGGESIVFARPTYQLGVGPFDRRALPDLALAASPQTPGYVVVQSGLDRTVGGTSAGAPAFSGMLALMLQHLGSDGVGHVLPRLYALAQAAARGERPSVFRDVTQGDNGFPAGPGFDLASGWGTPRGTALLAGLEDLPPGVCEPALGCMVPGRGGPRKACVAEWLIERERPDLGRRGLPAARQSCRDGDAECDADGLPDGRCIFRVALCTNVFDVRRLGTDGLPACPTRDLRSIRLVSPRTRSGGTGARTAEGAAAEALRAAITTLPVPTTLRAGCTPATSVAVPIPPGRSRGVMKLQARVRWRPRGGAGAGLVLRCEQ